MSVKASEHWLLRVQPPPSILQFWPGLLSCSSQGRVPGAHRACRAVLLLWLLLLLLLLGYQLLLDQLLLQRL